jgi:rubrerythrin
MSENLPETINKNVPVSAGFGNSDSFELLQRQAKLLASSELVPKEFQGKIANCVIALEMANRIGASPMAVLQNLYIVHGKPSWSSQFIIAALNSTGGFSPLRFAITGEGDQKTCVAWAIERETGERLESPPVSIQMAKDEGWLSRSGSKWKTMPELMLRYRSATFFGRLYAPQILMGMRTEEEARDIIDVTPEVATASDIVSRFTEIPSTIETVDTTTGEITDDFPADLETKPAETVIVEPEVVTEAAKPCTHPAKLRQWNDDKTILSCSCGHVITDNTPKAEPEPCELCQQTEGHAPSCPHPDNVPPVDYDAEDSFPDLPGRG